MCARRPHGQPTRGKTALNRLRQIDVYIALTCAEVLRGGAPLVVDLGFGAQPWTTLEMRARWLPINPQLRVVGVEIDVERVAAALPFAAPPAVDFARGGFNIAEALRPFGGRARLIRAYNVLRQYEEAAVGPALAALNDGLEDGGLLIEGTCTPTGRLAAFDLYQRREGALTHVALIFATNLRAEAAPVDFQAILPKRLIHHAHAPRPAAFFAAWARAQETMRGQGDRRRRWLLTGLALRARHGWPVDVRPRLLRRGYLTLYDTLAHDV
jgi:hypothetical protein